MSCRKVQYSLTTMLSSPLTRHPSPLATAHNLLTFHSPPTPHHALLLSLTCYSLLAIPPLAPSRRRLESYRKATSSFAPKGGWSAWLYTKAPRWMIRLCRRPSDALWC